MDYVTMSKVTSIQTILPANKISADVAAEIKIVLVKFPRIGNRTVLLWGTFDLQSYLDTLIIDERGDREGFPHSIASAIQRIHSKHYTIVSESKLKGELQF